MILLVDGYNVIHRVPELRPSLEGGLENARMRLVLGNPRVLGYIK